MFIYYARNYLRDIYKFSFISRGLRLNHLSFKMLKIPIILSNALLTHWVSAAEGFQPTAEVLDEEKLVADLCCVSSLMANT